MDDTSRAHAQELAKLGRAVREVREERGLSEHEVADAVRGISLAGLRAIEAGAPKRSLDYARLLRLADVLGIGRSALVRRAYSLDAECARRGVDAWHGAGLDDRKMAAEARKMA